jgi:glutamine cyclotransferase
LVKIIVSLLSAVEQSSRKSGLLALQDKKQGPSRNVLAIVAYKPQQLRKILITPMTWWSALFYVKLSSAGHADEYGRSGKHNY